MSKEDLQLTNKEKEVLGILWSSDEPLIASDIAKADASLNLNTVQAILRKLLSKELIEVADIVYSGTVLTRSYRPLINKRELLLQQFVDHWRNLSINKISIPTIVTTLLEHEKNEDRVISELEELLKERKKLLGKREE
ncbi:BlaI/MecI/CopY family transcriptional regulator [Gorillibacterium sp. CAU 1737]|uniref:BlaI/MecI/CopY family transcriptional regulator n=1 Tax=Gorillibacterium sp. CAU 1737 TaxID=3140362 RepID=UPI0032609CF9